jgi:hypothetical protein
MHTDFSEKKNLDIGVVSDTHGLFRPGIARTFTAVDLILHVGDSELPEILDSLREIAPLVAIRGNMDQGRWAEAIPVSKVVAAGGHRIYLVHSLDWMDLSPADAGVSAVVYGHTHLPDIRRHEGILYLNPGSAGPRRQIKPVSVAILRIRGESLDAEIIHLDE